MSGYEEYKKGPNFIYIISAVILLGMVFSAILVIRNVNEEYKIRQIAGAFQKYKYAYLSFNNVYSGLPGDLEKATFYWKGKTFDGDGNKKITHGNKEGVLAWQHLQLSGMVKNDGAYIGDWLSGQEGVLVAGKNIPAGSVEQTGYYFNFDEELGKNAIFYSGVDSNPGLPYIPSLTSSEAYRLDLIIDDGLPDTGNVTMISSEDGYCTAAGEYKESSEKRECVAKLEI